METPITPQLILSKIKVTSDGCWEWQGARCVVSRGGYGVVKFGGKMIGAHRGAWTVFRGPIPCGKYILHKCDNPPCVNPDHLYVGTAKDNARDAVERGHHSPGKCYGTQQPQAKLTEEKVVEIRLLRQFTKLTLLEIADSYGVSKKAILRVVHRTGWKHVA